MSMIEKQLNDLELLRDSLLLRDNCTARNTVCEAIDTIKRLSANVEELDKAQHELYMAYKGKNLHDGWIPITFHEVTDKEREEMCIHKDIAYLFDCQMPVNNEEILITTKHGTVEKDICYEDCELSLDSGYDFLDDVLAWKPLPSAYKEN